MTMSMTVQALAYYPVKGCAPVVTSSARVGETGLEHDRTFMVVDAVDGSFRSQRELPAMAVVRPRVEEDGAVLRLSAPGAGEVRLEVAARGPLRAVSMFGKPLGDAVDQGEEAAEWFSEALGAKHRLVRVAPGFDRAGWGETPGKVGFADAHALLVTAQSSLDALNRRIEAAGGRPVPMDRFRANIVLGGDQEPHAEDDFRRMTAGTAELAYAVRAMRCNVPLVDQGTGRRDGPEPIRTLATYRREPDYGNRVSFGVKAAVVRGGTVAVGDPVEITARSR